MKATGIHKKFRKCANCGRVYMPSNRSQQAERKDNSYCLHPLCREEKLAERYRRQIQSQRKFKKVHPEYDSNSKSRKTAPLYRDDKLCSCGNKIEIETEFPFSVEAPHYPYFCRECRNKQQYMRDNHNCVGNNKFCINFEIRENLD